MYVQTNGTVSKEETTLDLFVTYINSIGGSCRTYSLNTKVKKQSILRASTKSKTETSRTYLLLSGNKLMAVATDFPIEVYLHSCSYTQTKENKTKSLGKNNIIGEKNEVDKDFSSHQIKQYARKVQEINRASVKEISKRSRNCKSKNGSALVVIKIVILLLCLTVTTCENVNVTWDMKQDFIIFGQTAKLKCNINNPKGVCQSSHFQWYGGQNHKLLCRGKTCRNPEKYSEVKETDCSFTLKIYNFSESDINCEYTCYYGFSHQRKMLALDEQHFAYLPNTHEIIIRNKTMSNLTGVQDHIQVIIELTKVYPTPVCHITFQEENISRFVEIKKKYDGILYNLIFNISYSPSKCPGQLKMLCEIGNTIVTPYKENITMCLGEGNVERIVSPTLVAIGVGIGAIITMVFSIISLVLARRKKMCSRNTRKDIKYMECKRNSNGNPSSPL